MPELRYKFDDDGNLTSVICPRYVFKFAAITDYTLSALSEKYFWFSKPSEFNDVFELPTKIPKQFNQHQLKKYMLTNLLYHLPKMRNTLPVDDNLENIFDEYLTSHPGIARNFLVSYKKQEKSWFAFFVCPCDMMTH